MAQLLLLNPKRRKAKPKLKPNRKKARSAAQKAATKKLLAFNKKRRNPTNTTLRKNPVKKRRTAAQRAATRKLVAFNRSRKRASPTRRKTTAVARRRNPVSQYIKNPSRKRRAISVKRPAMATIHRRRKNPSKRMGIQKQAISAFQSSLGAIGLDLLWGYAPVPIDMKTGQFRHLIKGAGAIVMGMLAEMVISKPQAAKMVEGALVVTFHDAIKEFIAVNVPAVQLGYYSPGMPAGGNNMSAYVGGSETSPYLSRPLSSSFAGPSAPDIASQSCVSVDGEGLSEYY